MQDYGLISIITPTWECAAYISETVQSVLAQTYTNWELLIQDDCSTDGTDNVVLPFAELDARIKYERNSEPVGAALTRNVALRRAKGKWIAFLDADDLWMPEKLEKQLYFMVKNGFSFTYTCYEEMDDEGRQTGVVVRGPNRVSKFGMFAFCWPGCLTVMYDREAIGLVQIADIKKNNDYAMWLKVCREADCYLLKEVLAKYRRGRVGSISTQGYSKLIRWHYRLWHEAEGMSVVASIFWTGVNLVCGLYKKVRFVAIESTRQPKQ